MDAPRYIHLPPGEAPPQLDDLTPFKAIVVVDADVTSEWRNEISDWLVSSGCQYMMAWGRKCTEWEDSVDEASLARFDFREIPEDHFVMTTSHDDEPLQTAFWFSQFCAMHPSLELEKTSIVHISPESLEAVMLQTFAAAQKPTND